jgi:hypothetical protein
MISVLGPHLAFGVRAQSFSRRDGARTCRITVIDLS